MNANTAKLLCFAALAVNPLSGDDARLYIQLGHAGYLYTAAFSQDGRLVVTGSYDSTARLWDAASARELQVFRGHDATVWSAVISRDGRRVLTGSGDKTARLWDVATGRELKRFNGHTGEIKSVALSPDGKLALTGSDDKSVRLWDTATAKEIRRFQGHTRGVNAVAFSSDGRVVLTGSDDKTARLWDAGTGRETRRFTGHADGLLAAVFSADDKLIVTGGEEGEVWLWNVDTGAQIRRFQGPESQVYSVAISPDGKFVATGNKDKAARVWDASNGKELRRFGDHPDSVYSVVFSNDGKFVLTASGNPTARLFSIDSGSLVKQFDWQASSVRASAFSPDNKFLLVALDTGVAILLDVASGQEVKRFRGHTQKINEIAFSPDSRYAATASDDNTARVWDTATGLEVRQLRHSDSVESVVFSPDGTLILSGCDDNTARLWDAATGMEVRRFDHGDSVNAVTYSPDGRFVATGGDDNNTKIWNAKTGRQLGTLRGHTDSIESLAWSPDGRFILTGADDNDARLWNASSGQLVRRLSGHTDAVNSVVFSPDGNLALTASDDNTARLWDVRTGRELRRVNHTGAVYSVAFSSDGAFAVSGSYDGTARIWATRTGKELASLVAMRGGGWTLVAPDGRFDTDTFDADPAHWIVDSDPLHPLPLEIFMRDYYTPRMLAAVVSGAKLPDLPSISEIRNRVQPVVEISGVDPDGQGAVRVRVKASSVKSNQGQASGLQDLRLFRDGRLVGWRDGALSDGEFTFEHIQLPAAVSKVAFTAYAFNLARIKSSTTPAFAYTRPQTTARKQRAFLVQIGVNHYEAARCELRYAAADAHKLRQVLETRLRNRGIEANPTELISTSEGSTADSKSIRDALSAVAKEATPDDVFFLSFSGHGYSDPAGQFYLFPSDVQGSCTKPDAKLLANAISADQLAEWLRPIDAGEITFVLDSCYSAESVEANGFKPGPMGNRGLGQLAYDKRMRILAASQSDQTALEDSRFGQGLLSYVLTDLGLEKGEADWKPTDRKIMLGEWLAFAVNAVQKLSNNADGDEGTKGVKLNPARQAIRAGQIPALFDFTNTEGMLMEALPPK
jgi:WD40 repeat protein